MAAFSIANWDTLEKLMAYRPKTLKTAVTAVTAATAALKTAFAAIGDSNGIGSALYAAAMDADDALDALEQAAAAKFAALCATLWQSLDTTPDTDYLSFDEWFTAKKSSLTNPLMTNEMVETFRRLGGHISAANASGPSGTSYGTFVNTGADTGTKTLVGAPVDPVLYAGGLLEAVVVNGEKGGNAFTSNTTYTLTGFDINGSVWTGSVVVATDTAEGVATEVTPTIAKTYPVALTDVTVSGATALESVRFQIKEPRVIAAS